MSERAGRNSARMTPASVAWMPELNMQTHSTRPTTMYQRAEYTWQRCSAASTTTQPSDAATHGMLGVCP